MTFFKRFDWRVHTRSAPKQPTVNETWWQQECRRLLTEPWTDEDRAKAEEATRAYLASVEQGC